MFHTTAIIWVVLFIIGYAVATRGLFRSTHGLRLSLINLAAELIEDPDCPEYEKGKISEALDVVHSAKAAWWLVFCLVAYTISFPFIKTDKRVSPRFQEKLSTFAFRWILATVTNSVPASILFVAIMIITAAVVSSAAPIIILMLNRDNKRTPGKHAHAG